MDAELATEDGAVEIGSALWQKIFVAPIVLLFCGMGVIAAIGALCPHLLQHKSEELPDVWMRVALLFGGPFMFGLGAIMAQVWFYRLRADAYGITQSLGWKETRVFWSDVDSYTMEPNSNQHREERHHIEPILRAADGTVLFKSADTIVVCDKATVERRRQFWNVVQGHLPGKQKPYTPPPPIPSIYEGKSKAWKAKRITKLVFGAVTYVGLVSSLAMWAAGRPDLPSWALPSIGILSLAIPYGFLMFLIHAEKRRQQKLRSELEDAPTSTCSPKIQVQ